MSILIRYTQGKVEQREIFKNERSARKFLQDLADGIRKHPWHLARQKVEQLEDRRGAWIRQKRSIKTFNQSLILAEFEKDIAKAKEDWAMIDEPEKLVVNITNVK